MTRYKYLLITNFIILVLIGVFSICFNTPVSVYALENEQYIESELLFNETAKAQSINTFPISVIKSSGKPNNESIVVVFMGDGYTASQYTNRDGGSLKNKCYFSVE